tara:strand:+ start:300 stop:761 length:462 start_codon:yes stop_codon:yes gene_type:complete
MNKHIKTQEIFKSQFVNEKLYSCQVIATILAIENLMGENSNGISIYQKWIKSRGKRDIREATFSLVNLFLSIYSRGYDKNFPLEVNKDTLVMLGGAHRLGICIYLNIESVYCNQVDNQRIHPKKYDIEYFSNILSKEELEIMVEKIKKLRGQK